jgi:hypothetical protein
MKPIGWSDAMPKSAIFMLFLSSSSKFSGCAKDEKKDENEL